MTTEAPPVFVEVVCPSCEGRACVVCRHTGIAHARLATTEDVLCARCRIHCDGAADTLRPDELAE